MELEQIGQVWVRPEKKVNNASENSKASEDINEYSNLPVELDDIKLKDNEV